MNYLQTNEVLISSLGDIHFLAGYYKISIKELIWRLRIIQVLVGGLVCLAAWRC